MLLFALPSWFPLVLDQLDYLNLLNYYRTHRTPAGTVDLLSSNIIIMHVQNTQEKRCQILNLSLTIMLQLWVGLTLKTWSLLLLHRSSILYLHLCGSLWMKQYGACFKIIWHNNNSKITYLEDPPNLALSFFCVKSHFCVKCLHHCLCLVILQFICYWWLEVVLFCIISHLVFVLVSLITSMVAAVHAWKKGGVIYPYRLGNGNGIWMAAAI